MLKYFIRFLILLFVLGLGRVAYEYIIDLPPLDLRQVQITGNWDISPDSAATIAGLEIGVSIFRQDLKFASEKIMRQPGVVYCLIERRLPSTITIDTRHAEPLLMINASQILTLSREGLVLPVSSNQPILPLVTGKKFSGARCYDHLNDPDIVSALSFYEQLLNIAPGLCARLSELNCSNSKSLRIIFSPDGTEIIIDKSDLKNGAQRLASLDKLGMIKDRKKFDLRYGPVIVETGNDGGKKA